MPTNKKATKATSGYKSSQISELLLQLAYPGAQSLPVTDAPTGIKILEMVAVDPWQQVLQHYQKLLVAEGWTQFAQHQQTDRGTYSFRQTSTVITVLAAQSGDKETRIRIYFQQ
jgi:hypothetical protein